jgi:predicted nuclease of predicted toxin-antitoxin system
MAIVRALRRNGYDVLAVVEAYAGAEDTDVAEMARADRRRRLTQDRDFGRLVQGIDQATNGVIYMRYNSRTRESFAEEVTEVVGREGDRLANAFTVLQPGRIRIGCLPPTSP